jgi:hypothetical protein
MWCAKYVVALLRYFRIEGDSAQSRNGALCKVGAGNFHGFKYRWQDNDHRIWISKVAASFFIPQY